MRNGPLWTSRISKVGICGRKSFPTKKHMKTKSSTIRSKFISNGESDIAKSFSKYSRKTQMFRNWPQSRRLVHIWHVCVWERENVRKTTKTGIRDWSVKNNCSYVQKATWYFFLWMGMSTTALPFTSEPLQSAARCPIWPQEKHFSCCPGIEITCPTSCKFFKSKALPIKK